MRPGLGIERNEDAFPRFPIRPDGSVGFVLFVNFAQCAHARPRNGASALARFVDTWTFLAFLAARTTRIRFFPDVVNLALRPPAVATLDRLIGDRVELGLGSGGVWDAIVSMGGVRCTPAEAVALTEEAMRIIRLVWQEGQSVSFDGRHYQLRNFPAGPSPAHPVGLWLGVARPRMLRLTGRLSDGWVRPLNVYLPPEHVPAAQAIIDEAARRAGRAPTEVRRIYNVAGAIDAPSARRGGLSESAEEWAQTLSRWVSELGFDTFVFWPAPASREQVERFATEVVPRTRELVERARQHRETPSSGLFNTPWALILPYISGGHVFAIFILRQFFAAIPEELFEAARIDGASEARAFATISVPLSQSILGVVAIMHILNSWNDLIWPLVTLTSQSNFTLTLGLYAFRNENWTNWGPLFAGYVIASIPLLIVFALTSRLFVEGLASGALKM